MRIPTFAARTLFTTAIGALLAGCRASGPSQGVSQLPAFPPPASQSGRFSSGNLERVALLRGSAGGRTRLLDSLSPDTQEVMYATEYSGPRRPNGGVFAYKVTAPPGSPILRLTTPPVNMPYGLATKGRDIYVANTGGRNILIYRVGARRPSREVKDAFGYPSAIAVGNDGTIYVANASGTNGSPPGNVYSVKGARVTHYSWPWYDVMGIAVDSSNNLYVSNDTGATPGAQVIKFPAGSTTGSNTGIPLNYPGGLAEDAHDNLLVTDQGVSTVDVYAPGSNRASHVIPWPSGGFGVEVALNKANNRLYMSDRYNGEIQVVKYPTGTFVQSYNSGLSNQDSVVGVAVWPGSDI